MSKNEFIDRHYYCSYCKEKHTIKLPKRLVEGKDNFPVSHFYLHGELDNILSTLYVDANLNIRGTETVKLGDEDNIFSQGQAQKIINGLVEQISILQKEFNELQQKYDELVKK